MKKLKFPGEEKGQATVEFVLVMILFFSFFLFYFQLALTFAYGNYVHYATFMAARAYLSAGNSDQTEQRARAQSVIVTMLKKSEGQTGTEKYPFIGTPPQGSYNAFSGCNISDPPNVPLSGVRYTFKSKLFMIPMGGASSLGGSANSVTLTSESFLGREPTASECSQFMGNASSGNVKLYDNGC